MIKKVQTFFLLCTLLSCKNESLTNTAAFSNDWNIQSGALVTLEVITKNNTYFKETEEMVRGNATYSAKKCGLKLGAQVTFKFSSLLDSNQKYAQVEMVSVDSNSKTFDVVGNFCDAGSTGLIFKSDFAIVKKASSNIVRIQEPDLSNPKKNDDTSLPKIPNSDKVYVGHDTYVTERTQKYITVVAAGKNESSIQLNINKTVYSKDGKKRFYSQDQIRRGIVNFWPGTTFTSKKFITWEGQTEDYVLVPLGRILNSSDDNGVFFADACETLAGNNVSKVASGRRMTSCQLPQDENGYYWMWVHCNDVINSGLRCSNSESQPFSAR